MSKPSSPSSSRTALTLLLGLAGFWLLASVSEAQTPQRRRLVLDIELQRQGPVQSGPEHGEQKLSQRWQLSALLETDGSPIPYNPLDPQDHRRQLQAAQSAQARAERIAATAPAAPMPDLAALQARAQALQAKCGQDSACLMREASALSAAAMPAGTQGRLQAYGNAAAACEKQPAGKARSACQAEARRQAGGGVEAPEDDGPATPYLMFNGVAACGLQLSAKLDERVQGRFGDVQGWVNYTETAQGQETRRDDQSCPTLQVVLDTRNGRVWTSLGIITQDVQGVRTREDTGRRPQRSEGRLSLRWMEAQDWLQQKLTQLNAGGQDQARLGASEIRMKWSFRPA